MMTNSQNNPFLNDSALGTVTQIIGPVVDVAFAADHLPQVYFAVDILIPGQAPLVVEVQQQLSNNWVRCMAMGPTQGLRRGLKAVNRGAPISVPVGKPVLGAYDQCPGRADRRLAATRKRRAAADPQPGAALPGSIRRCRGV